MQAKILVVDDEVDLELLIKQKFRRKIRDNEYAFFFAHSGKEALLKLEEQPDIDIVLSDINMPEMDGLTLLTELARTNPVIKTVMVSAYGDMDNIRMAMNHGAFDFVCKPVNFTDLEMTMEKTLRQVYQLRDTLQAIKENNILKMYVDDTVLRFMTHQQFENSLLSNETIEATVAFFDICSFTSITESLPANIVVDLLNNYFDVIVQEIIAFGGYVDKFIGDAVMAVFRGDYHLDRAIDAALAVRLKMQTIEERVAADATYLPKVSTGINTGEMVSGNIGSVSLKRLDYTVIGDVVNMAQRLQSVAQPGQILISEVAYHLVKESFHCERIGEVRLKNKAQAVVIYQVLE